MPEEILPCGCYEGACYCGQYPTREELAEMEAERSEGVAVLMVATDHDRYPTLAERLAESMKDDRRADR